MSRHKRDLTTAFMRMGAKQRLDRNRSHRWLSLSDARRAHELLESSAAKGKLVLVPEPGEGTGLRRVLSTRVVPAGYGRLTADKPANTAANRRVRPMSTATVKRTTDVRSCPASTLMMARGGIPSSADAPMSAVTDQGLF